MLRTLYAALALVVAALAALPVRAADQTLQLAELVEPVHGSRACWRREYSRSHLARHPDQLVTIISLSIDYRQTEPAAEGHYHFGVDVLRRGDSGSGNSHGVCFDEAVGIVCYVECDGGGFLLRSSAKGDGLLLDMTHIGSLTLAASCDALDDGAPLPPLVPGEDDHVFLLAPADPRSCPPAVSFE